MFRPWNAGTSTMWITTTCPRSSRESSCAAVRIAASIPGYSPPCAPPRILPRACRRPSYPSADRRERGRVRSLVWWLGPGPPAFAGSNDAEPASGRRRGRADPRLEIAEGDRRQRDPQRLRQGAFDSRPHVADGDRAPEQPGHRRHRLAETARVDQGEMLERRIHVERKPVHGDAALDRDPDRGDLRARDPRPGEPAYPLGEDPPRRERRDQGPLEQPHVAHHVLVERAQIEDGVADKLARPMVRHIAAALHVVDVDAARGE